MSFGRVVDGDEFDEFLKSIVQQPLPLNRRFVARNFLLDEGVCPPRQDSYGAEGAGIKHVGFGKWVAAHKNYLEGQIFLKRRQSPTQIDRSDEENCPETFRHQSAFKEFGAADSSLDLIRVEEVTKRVASNAGLSSVDELLEMARAVLADPSSASSAQGLNSALKTLYRSRDLRPVWAAFWQDAHDLFGPDASDDAPDWADELRDRLGLYHLDPLPLKKDIPVLVFRYPVGILPRLKGEKDLRPIAIPTVLDGRFSQAFCPPPAGGACGYAVYLGQRPYEMRREILHPSIKFEAAHLFRIGTITRGVPDDLTSARRAHIKQLRIKTGRADYAPDE